MLSLFSWGCGLGTEPSTISKHSKNTDNISLGYGDRYSRLPTPTSGNSGERDMVAGEPTRMKT
jgi:hypothetical protein